MFWGLFFFAPHYSCEMIEKGYGLLSMPDLVNLVNLEKGRQAQKSPQPCYYTAA